MSLDKQLPLAVLAAGALIAVGLYFGLRGRSDAVSTPQSVGSTIAPPPNVPEPPSTTTPATSPGGATPSAEKARENVKQALEAEKTRTFVPKCWTPLLAKTPSPPLAKFRFEMTFDATGKEIARAISEDRRFLRSDVAICLRAIPLGLTIPAPGAALTAQLELAFP